MVPAAHVQEADRVIVSLVHPRSPPLPRRLRLAFHAEEHSRYLGRIPFDNQQTFSRCFKKHFAESPSVYRHARKQDFSNLVRSLAASQPGDIQVERVSIARGQYAFHGKRYAYHLDIEKLDKSHLPQRSALRGQFYTLLGERPTQTYSFTQLVPDGERVRVDYTLGVTTEYPLREGVMLEPLPEIHGEFCRFRYSGKPVALNDHIIQIYTQVLPEWGWPAVTGRTLRCSAIR